MPTAQALTPVDDFVYTDIHFEIPQRDLIPNVAAVRASCNLNASGEPLKILANGSTRSTLAASAGPCTIVVVLFGVDVTLPVFNTTPIGRSSFYLPGISTVTLGIVDLSVDLVTSMNSTSAVDSGIAEVSPREIAWPTWGAQRIVVHGEDGLGSIEVSSLRTSFTYTMSLALTVYALSIEIYHLALADIGSFVGSPVLRTDLSVDLRPHGLALAAAGSVRHDRATLSWSGTVDEDVDHLELWLSDGAHNVSARLGVADTQTDVLLRSATSYQAWIVAVDRSGQATPSNGIAFESLSALGETGSSPLGGLSSPAFGGVMVVVAILVAIMGYTWGFARGRKRE